MFGALDTAGTDPAGRGMSAAFGVIGVIIAAVAGVVLFFGRKSTVALILAALVLGAIPAFFATWMISLSRSDARARQEMEELASGRFDFGHDPALFAVADAIARNDPEAIRGAAKSLTNLQQPGREGKTLLNFAVTKCWSRPDFVTAVRALLDAGADPNFTNESRDSYAMANSIHGPVTLLRAMLDAGGNPNAVDEFGVPMIFGNWHLQYHEKERRARLELMVERGVDVNAIYPREQYTFSGYPLVLFRANVGRGEYDAYADAIYLLEHGADATRAAPDGTTLAQMVTEHREFFATTGNPVPAEHEALARWLEAHGVATARQ
jgi:hypothetical protein